MRTSRIERAAKAISFMVPLQGVNCIELKNGALTGWTAKGLATVKWPKDFTVKERKLIRAIARTAISKGER